MTLRRRDTGVSAAESHYAFAAVEAIKAGEWDRYLPSLRAAIQERQSDAEYKREILSRVEFRAGATPDLICACHVPNEHPLAGSYQDDRGFIFCGRGCAWAFDQYEAAKRDALVTP